MKRVQPRRARKQCSTTRETGHVSTKTHLSGKDLIITSGLPQFGQNLIPRFPKYHIWTANEKGGYWSSEKRRKSFDLYIAIWEYSCMAMDKAVDRLSSVFAALADPTRRAILARLASGDADVSELMRPFDLRQPTISKHLSVLERAGLVMRTREAQRRPRTLVAVPLKDVADWIDPFRRFWEQKFASLDGYLEEMQKKEKTRGRKKR